MKNTRKIPYSLKWDWLWLTQTNITLTERVIFIFRKYKALIARLRRIKYLGINIDYDNVNTPMSLESYPYEINRLHHEINFKDGCDILDIGANIGQFSITIGALFPRCKLYAFEANPEIFHYLNRNTASLPNICTFNTAVGPKGKMPFYYLAGRSASGGFLKENIGVSGQDNDIRELEVDVEELTLENCHSLGIPQKYDLIKIDVEGFEYQVLGTFKGITARYLYVEYSTASARQCDYEMIDLYKRIEEVFGRFSVIHCDRISPELSMGDMLVKFLDKPTSTGNSPH